MNAHDAAWVATLLARAADNEQVHDDGRTVEVWAECSKTEPGILTVTIYRPGVEEPVATARVTVELTVAEEPDPTPDHQWQVTEGGQDHDAEYRDAWDEAARLWS